MSIKEFVKAALEEDIGRGDLFERTVVPSAYEANIISKEDGVFAGELYAKELLEAFGIDYVFFVADGEKLQKGSIIANLKGKDTDILKLERTLLNMMQHASGIATKAARFAALAKMHGVMVLDTRKTRPGLRVFEKYATRCGGITNHRMGLDDALMLKDTHLKAIRNLEEYIKEARKKIPFSAKIEIECESVEIAKEALSLGVDIVMCDNMRPQAVEEVVNYKKKSRASALIECSGNIDEQNFAEYAKTGVDAISIGKIIHQATWLDFSMKGV